jgi:hypothetical protein
VPSSWKEAIVSWFESLDREKLGEVLSDADEISQVERLYSYLDILETTTVSAEGMATIADRLRQLLLDALCDQSRQFEELNAFAVAKGFAFYVQIAAAQGVPDTSLWTQICASSPKYYVLPEFIMACLSYLQRLRAYVNLY